MRVPEAGPGFLAETTGVSSTTLLRFIEETPQAGGEEFEQPEGPEGVFLDARLFTQPGRFFLDLSEVRVLSVVDGLKRPVEPIPDATTRETRGRQTWIKDETISASCR